MQENIAQFKKRDINQKKELKSKHISLPLSDTNRSTENKKISKLKNTIINIKTNSYGEFKKQILELI